MLRGSDPYCDRMQAPAPHRAIHAWLLLLPAMALLVAFTHWPAVATLWTASISTPRRRGPSRFVGLDNYAAWSRTTRSSGRRSGTTLVRARHDPGLDRARASLMALWVNDAAPAARFLRMAYFTPTVLPMIAVANIWLFFYTPQYGLLEQITRPLGLPPPQLARQPGHGARRGDRRGDLEGGRLLHDLLPGGAAGDLAARSPRRPRSKAPRAGHYFRRVQFPLLMPTTLFVLINAVINSFRMVDHIIVMTRGGPDNATHAAALLHLSGRLQLLGHGLRGRADGRGAARCSALVALFQFGFLERRMHYR